MAAPNRVCVCVCVCVYMCVSVCARAFVRVLVRVCMRLWLIHVGSNTQHVNSHVERGWPYPPHASMCE